MSIVPTTAERLAGSVTNGVAHSRDSAQPYSVAADVALRWLAPREAAVVEHPLDLRRRACTSVPSAGVL